MKSGSYFVVLLLAVAGVVLTAALIMVEHTNQQLQIQLQSQQQALSQGVLGQQAQQISAGVLQDMAHAAVENSAIRQVLEKHGYRVPSSRSPASVMNPPGKKMGEPTPSVTPIP